MKSHPYRCAELRAAPTLVGPEDGDLRVRDVVNLVQR